MRITTGKPIPIDDDREGLDVLNGYLENERNEEATLRVTTYKQDDEINPAGIVLVGSVTDSQRVTLFNLTYAEAYELAHQLQRLLP